jgi:hypothetical protein
MKMLHRCFVIVPSKMSDLYAQLVSAFADEPQVFVLRDRRKGPRRPLDLRLQRLESQTSLEALGVFAVGGGELDPEFRRSVEAKLRSLGFASL